MQLCHVTFCRLFMLPNLTAPCSHVLICKLVHVYMSFTSHSKTSFCLNSVALVATGWYNCTYTRAHTHAHAHAHAHTHTHTHRASCTCGWTCSLTRGTSPLPLTSPHANLRSTCCELLSGTPRMSFWMKFP